MTIFLLRTNNFYKKVKLNIQNIGLRYYKEGIVG
jgi:hypothetical protein